MLPFILASQWGCLVVLVMTPCQIPNLQPPPFCILIFYFVEYVHRHIGLIFFRFEFPVFTSNSGHHTFQEYLQQLNCTLPWNFNFDVV